MAGTMLIYLYYLFILQEKLYVSSYHYLHFTDKTDQEG